MVKNTLPPLPLAIATPIISELEAYLDYLVQEERCRFYKTSSGSFTPLDKGGEEAWNKAVCSGITNSQALNTLLDLPSRPWHNEFVTLQSELLTEHSIHTFQKLSFLIQHFQYVCSVVCSCLIESPETRNVLTDTVETYNNKQPNPYRRPASRQPTRPHQEDTETEKEEAVEKEEDEEVRELRDAPKLQAQRTFKSIASRRVRRRFSTRARTVARVSFVGIGDTILDWLKEGLEFLGIHFLLLQNESCLEWAHRELRTLRIASGYIPVPILCLVNVGCFTLLASGLLPSNTPHPFIPIHFGPITQQKWLQPLTSLLPTPNTKPLAMLSNENMKQTAHKESRSARVRFQVTDSPMMSSIEEEEEEVGNLKIFRNFPNPGRFMSLLSPMLCSLDVLEEVPICDRLSVSIAVLGLPPVSQAADDTMAFRKVKSLQWCSQLLNPPSNEDLESNEGSHPAHSCTKYQEIFHLWKLGVTSALHNEKHTLIPKRAIEVGLAFDWSNGVHLVPTMVPLPPNWSPADIVPLAASNFHCDPFSVLQHAPLTEDEFLYEESDSVWKTELLDYRCAVWAGASPGTKSLLSPPAPRKLRGASTRRLLLLPPLPFEAPYLFLILAPTPIPLRPELYNKVVNSELTNNGGITLVERALQKMRNQNGAIQSSLHYRGLLHSLGLNIGIASWEILDLLLPSNDDHTFTSMEETKYHEADAFLLAIVASDLVASSLKRALRFCLSASEGARWEAIEDIYILRSCLLTFFLDPFNDKPSLDPVTYSAVARISVTFLWLSWLKANQLTDLKHRGTVVRDVLAIAAKYKAVFLRSLIDRCAFRTSKENFLEVGALGTRPIRESKNGPFFLPPTEPLPIVAFHENPIVRLSAANGTDLQRQIQQRPPPLLFRFSFPLGEFFDVPEKRTPDLQKSSFTFCSKFCSCLKKKKPKKVPLESPSPHFREDIRKHLEEGIIELKEGVGSSWNLFELKFLIRLRIHESLSLLKSANYLPQRFENSLRETCQLIADYVRSKGVGSSKTGLPFGVVIGLVTLSGIYSLKRNPPEEESDEAFVSSVSLPWSFALSLYLRLFGDPRAMHEFCSPLAALPSWILSSLCRHSKKNQNALIFEDIFRSVRNLFKVPLRLTSSTSSTLSLKKRLNLWLSNASDTLESFNPLTNEFGVNTTDCYIQVDVDKTPSDCSLSLPLLAPYFLNLIADLNEGKEQPTSYTSSAPVAPSSPSWPSFDFSLRLYALGSNLSGSLGFGSEGEYGWTAEFNNIPSCRYLHNESQVCCGTSHSIILSNSRVFQWGLRTSKSSKKKTHQSIDPIELSLPRPLPLLKDKVIQVGCMSHSCIMVTESEDEKRTLLTWGDNSCGQLGHGDFKDREIPTLVPHSENFEIQSITCGAEFAICLSRRGALWVWGRAHEHQLGLPLCEHSVSNTAKIRCCCKPRRLRVFAFPHDQQTPFAKSSPPKQYFIPSKSSSGETTFHKSGSNESSASQSRSSVPLHVDRLSWYRDSGHSEWIAVSGSETLDEEPTDIDPLEISFIKVAAAHEHALALDLSNQLWAWGKQSEGKLGLSNQQISDHDQNNEWAPPSRVAQVPQLNDQRIVTISAGKRNSAAIDTYGRLFLWGSNKHFALASKDVDQSLVAATPQVAEAFADMAVESMHFSACGNRFAAITLDREQWRQGDDTKYNDAKSLIAWGSGSHGCLGMLNDDLPAVPLYSEAPLERESISAVEAKKTHNIRAQLKRLPRGSCLQNVSAARWSALTVCRW